MGRVRHVFRLQAGNYTETIGQSGLVTDSVSVNIIPAVSETFDFASDWASSLGNSDSAVRDSLKATPWADRWGGSSVLDVVASTGLDFPTSRCLRVTMGTGSFDWAMSPTLTTLTTGQTRYFRMYLRNAVTAAGGYAATHPIESANNQGGISGLYYTIHTGGVTNTTRFIWMLDAGGFGHQVTTNDQTGSDPGTLLLNTSYRLEWAFTRISSTSHSLQMRIYDSSNTLLFDNNNLEIWGGGTVSSGSNAVCPVDDSHVSQIRLGLNGGYSAPAGNYMYYAGFATRRSGWCGPYTAAG